jgi:hypothetical protein
VNQIWDYLKSLYLRQENLKASYRRADFMLLTIFLAIVFCAAITLMLLLAVAFHPGKRYSESCSSWRCFNSGSVCVASEKRAYAHGQLYAVSDGAKMS